MKKQCFKCLVTKPLDCFYKHSKMADGHVNKCKECNKKDVSANYREHIDHYKQYEKTRMYAEHRVKARADYGKTESGKKARQTATNNFRAKNPIKFATHSIVGYALLKKRLLRPNECSNCNIECIPDGHHCDYAYPLEVTWLCRQCHNDWHKVNTALNGD